MISVFCVGKTASGNHELAVEYTYVEKCHVFVSTMDDSVNSVWQFAGNLADFRFPGSYGFAASVCEKKRGKSFGVLSRVYNRLHSRISMVCI